jgi:NAD(P)-dependent dehydrogenase (short-subunit alcohol dehydrogenase family)
MSTQHVFIAGGSSGIGLATARRLLAGGYRVTIAGRDRQRLQTAQAVLDGKASAQTMDAADAASVRQAYAAAGAFDHLVLALSSRKGFGAFASIDPVEVRQGFDEKFMPHFACAQAALPQLRKDGSITFVSAVSAQGAMPGTAGISAANAAVAALVPVLAVELKPLRVNGVLPGVIDTPWWDFLDAGQKAPAFADFASRTPVGRVGQPDDVAQAIIFLIDCGFVSGHNLLCDGGLRLAV